MDESNSVLVAVWFEYLSNVVFFRVCPRSKSKIQPWCPGKATTLGDRILSTRRHNHISDPVDLKVKQATRKVLQQAKENPTLKTSQLMHEWAKNTMGPAERSKACSMATMQRKLQWTKCQVQDHTGVPQSLEELAEIPQHFRETFDGERFLLVNRELEGGGRILIFASHSGLDMLRRAETWSADGTFSVAKPLFQQLYTILAELDGRSYPAAFSFLSDKRAPTYKVMLEELNQHLLIQGPLALDHFLIDFEGAMIKEIRAVFGRLQITGCHVHFRRNLRAKIQEVKNLVTWQCKDQTFSEFLNCLAGLCFVPTDLVHTYYQELIDVELPKVLEIMHKSPEMDPDETDALTVA